MVRHDGTGPFRRRVHMEVLSSSLALEQGHVGVFKFPILRGLYEAAQAAIVFTCDVDIVDGCSGSPPCYAWANPRESGDALHFHHRRSLWRQRPHIPM